MKSILTFLFTLSISFLFAQLDTIHFANPSFEGKPHRGHGRTPESLPKGIYDCENGVSIPDILPGAFEKNLKPEAPDHGKTYLGMVTREDNTHESVSQKISKKIVAGSCYSFSVSLASSNDYLNSGDLQYGTQYNLPAILKIYGGDDYCEKIELLWTSPTNIRRWWQVHTVDFLAGEDYSHLTFEANYLLPDLILPGNILLDNLSPIFEKNCD